MHCTAVNNIQAMTGLAPSKCVSLEIPKDLNEEGYARHASDAEAALNSLKDSSYSDYRSEGGDDDDDTLLLQLTAYTDPASPWSTIAASQIARSILASMPPERTARFVVDTVLQRHLRPIFSQATSKVTAAGRPSLFPEQDTSPASARGGVAEPVWKKNNGLTAVPIFAWAVEASDSDVIQTNWPLFMPVLLTFLDDRETSVRKKGLEILINFLNKSPTKILTSTGIGTIFEEAVFPTLLYLPSLTPEADSVALLRPAYAALLALAESDQNPRSENRRRLLDKMLRDGVFATFNHAVEWINIMHVLVDTINDIVSALHIFAAKHLQNILPIISSVITDPFATANGPALLSAAKALNTCLRECWPRVSDIERIGDITRMIIVCWLNVHSATATPNLPAAILTDLEEELQLTSKMLRVLRDENDLVLPPKVSDSIRRDRRLDELFPTADATYS